MVTPRIALVRAPNPSPLTLSGTNSYVIDGGNGEAICIDPGPLIEAHVAELLRTAAEMGTRITAICLTHGHPDHAPAAALLKTQTGALVRGHAKISVPHDRVLADGDIVSAGAVELKTIETPGHSADCISFFEPQLRALFTGDTILGEGYVVITQPEGDMRAYIATLERLVAEYSAAAILYGGHGEPVHDPAAKLHDYLQHRRAREQQILEALRTRESTAQELVETIYAQTDKKLWPAAQEQLLAYLTALEREGRVRSSGDATQPRYSLV